MAPGADDTQVFNQEFIVDERYNVTKELGQGAYGIVW
jgi:mitogen-activated protein kinase 7